VPPNVNVCRPARDLWNNSLLAEQPDTETPADAGGGPTILVVDDDEEVREIVVEFLSQTGYRILQAGGGAEALRVVAETPDIDLVITDVRMPDISGLDLADRLERQRRHLKVILISGFFVSEGVRRRVVRKPFRMQELQAAVREELAR
jgi:CheY-like chemotaxis protein